jgi:toxin ParE1/3/4
VKPVRYLIEAREEFLHEVSYFSSIDPSVGQRFDAAIQKAEFLIAEFPELGMAYEHGTRRVFPGKFKFSVVYLVRREEVVVIAIAPFKRKPGYWHVRTAAAR